MEILKEKVVKFANKAGVIYLIIVALKVGDRWFIGHALKSPSDEYSRRIGIQIARERAMQKVKVFPLIPATSRQDYHTWDIKQPRKTRKTGRKLRGMDLNMHQFLSAYYKGVDEFLVSNDFDNSKLVPALIVAEDPVDETIYTGMEKYTRQLPILRPEKEEETSETS